MRGGSDPEREQLSYGGLLQGVVQFPVFSSSACLQLSLFQPLPLKQLELKVLVRPRWWIPEVQTTLHPPNMTIPCLLYNPARPRKPTVFNFENTKYRKCIYDIHGRETNKTITLRIYGVKTTIVVLDVERWIHFVRVASTWLTTIRGTIHVIILVLTIRVLIFQIIFTPPQTFTHKNQ